MDPFFTNDTVTLGALFTVLALIFYTANSENKFLKKFYSIVPAILLCYFIPGLLNSAGIISSTNSKLYFVSSRYFLPASIVLLTLSVDIKGIIKLGPKSLIMFLTGSVGIVIGGPIAILIVSLFSPETVGGGGADAVWRALSTTAGSWIGGAPNQTAMKEIFEVSDALFSAIIIPDVVVAYIWMALLLYGAGITKKIDAILKADTSAIDDLKIKLENFRKSVDKNPSANELIQLFGVAFGVAAVAHFFADIIGPFFKTNYPHLAQYSITSNFFWMIVIATFIGIILSFTKVREMEGIGASKFGTVFLYFLVATIGMEMDILAILKQPGLFVVLAIWILVHITLMLMVAKLIKAPFFFVAVGSQANIGGAVSAPIVASAFHPSLATIGVLLAVLGYAVGTYGAWLCAIMMQAVAP